MNIKQLIAKVEDEGWTAYKKNGTYQVEAYGKVFPLVHPFSIYSKLYREEENGELKYQFLKKMHDMLWPNAIWHFWTERRFRAHCEGWRIITYAGGAGSAKSYSAAQLAILFWASDPAHNAVVVASTTLEGLMSRVWGYIMNLLNEAAIELPYHYARGKPPKILYDKNDTIHGIFAVAAKQGDDERTISSWIGRHPKRKLMVILDEATDMPSALNNAITNLERGTGDFQLLAIGNSNSKFDLHGSLSTPKIGWDKIDPLTHNTWETTRNKGICLFFSCYESPAIMEADPELRKKLGNFLITKEQIDEAIKDKGADSEQFYRFILGFWKPAATDSVILSEAFLQEYSVTAPAEWSGQHPLQIVGGLDPAFSAGGDNCILRLAVLGVDVNGKFVLDFKGDSLLFYIKISAVSGESAELQISNAVISTCNKLGLPVSSLVVDATGQGRAIAEVLRLASGSVIAPKKIYTTRTGINTVNSFDVIIKTSYDLWFSLRPFIQQGQIRGLDKISLYQMGTRLVQVKNGKTTLETKKEYKTRMRAVLPSLARSPDEADAIALCLQSAILNYGFIAGGKANIVPEFTNEYDKRMFLHHTQLKMEQQKPAYEPIVNFATNNLKGFGKRRF